MASVEGVAQLLNQLQALITGAKADDVSVSVGYTAGYALYVHEDLTKKHAEGTQAKFLEQPARILFSDGTLAGIITKTKQQGGTLKDGLLLAGLRIQRESQILCPVDTGALRASAFTRCDEGE